MSSFDIKRVRALFLYDWMLEKRRIGLTALIVFGLYIVLAWFIWWVNSQIGQDVQDVDYMPLIMLRSYCPIFFGVLAFLSVFFVTPILQRKFTKPQTATSYLTLPGTMVEKYWVMLAEYLLGFVACAVAYLVCFYGTALIGSLIDHAYLQVTTWEGTERPSNAYGWFDYPPFYSDEFAKGWAEMWEDFNHKSGEGDPHHIVTLLHTLFGMIPVVALLELGYYLVLNMLFRAYGQIKSILCYLGTQMCLNMVFTFFAFCIFSYINGLNGIEAEQAADTLINVVIGILWLLPVLMVGMYYLLYRLMQRKQAK